MKNRIVYLLTLLLIPAAMVFSQQTGSVTPGRFDQGKMWTFENPPLDYFEETYGFRPDTEWMDDVRSSALRFATWCSASFISDDGLILTNHHCSRGVVAQVMEEGENFDEQGFYAETLNDERRVEDLFVDQMVRVEDVTALVEAKVEAGISEGQALEQVQAEYQEKPDWKDLVIESRTFYSGGAYSLYGFKRYNDIRLVLYPELALGYFGGDPDNFTYPRYNLDFTLWRAYDENGNPLQPSNYFTFNAAGASEGEAVFVIGNPGSTGRFKTMAELGFDREVQVPAVLDLLRGRMTILEDYAETIDDVYKKDSVVNVFFSLSNSNKAYTGRLEGLNNETLMARKAAKEERVRANAPVTEGEDPWETIEANVEQMMALYPDLVFIGQSGIKGKVLSLLHYLYGYGMALESEEEEAMKAQQESIEELMANFDYELEEALFATLLKDLQKHTRSDVLAGLVEGTPAQTARELMAESDVFDPKKRAKLLDSKPDKYKTKDPLVELAYRLVPAYQSAAAKYGQLSAANQAQRAKVTNLTFQLSGDKAPPDATFSLRLADGVVKKYRYNGTIAPYKTTYFGLYDRHYSHDQQYPWDLPERWKNPPLELLRQPLNFVSTNDIIGGNSGSPVINTRQEVVGLVFDGNIESLPGYFIYDDQFNRTVSVHAGGIAGALLYIYKADRIVEELNID